MPGSSFRQIFCAFVLILSLSPAAFGQGLSGYASFEYADYSAKEGGEEVVSGSHLAQKYSFVWCESWIGLWGYETTVIAYILGYRRTCQENSMRVFPPGTFNT